MNSESVIVLLSREIVCKAGPQAKILFYIAGAGVCMHFVTQDFPGIPKAKLSDVNMPTLIKP